MIHVGIDLHSNNMVIIAINSNGKAVREAKIPTCPKALEQFFGSFNGPVQAVVEYTSFWYWLSNWGRDHNIALTLAHSKMVKAISYAKVKTDKVDAKTLAELLRADLIPQAGNSCPTNTGCHSNLLAPAYKPACLRGAATPCAGLGNRPAGRLKIWDSGSTSYSLCPLMENKPEKGFGCRQVIPEFDQRSRLPAKV